MSVKKPPSDAQALRILSDALDNYFSAVHTLGNLACTLKDNARERMIAEATGSDQLPPLAPDWEDRVNAARRKARAAWTTAQPLFTRAFGLIDEATASDLSAVETRLHPAELVPANGNLAFSQHYAGDIERTG